MKTRLNAKEWLPWIEIMDSCRICDIIYDVRTYAPELLKVVALALSAAKWHPLRDEVRRGHGTCGCCEAFYCHFNCPLPMGSDSCCNNLYGKWNSPHNWYAHQAAADKMFYFVCEYYNKALKEYRLECREKKS
jgi:hypothetical protein